MDAPCPLPWPCGDTSTRGRTHQQRGRGERASGLHLGEGARASLRTSPMRATMQQRAQKTAAAYPAPLLPWRLNGNHPQSAAGVETLPFATASSDEGRSWTGTRVMIVRVYPSSRRLHAVDGAPMRGAPPPTGEPANYSYHPLYRDPKPRYNYSGVVRT